MLHIDFAIRTARYVQSRTLLRAVERHAQNIWGEEYQLVKFTPDDAPPLPSFHVIRASIPHGHVRCAYLTCGAATAGADREREFLLLAREHSSAHIETLARVAAVHAQTSAGVDVGDIVDIGRPWIDGAMASRVIASRPHRRAPRVGSFAHGDRKIRVLWLRPISELEAGYAKTRGLASFYRRIDDDDIDFTDPHRPHVV